MTSAPGGQLGRDTNLLRDQAPLLDQARPAQRGKHQRAGAARTSHHEAPDDGPCPHAVELLR